MAERQFKYIVSQFAYIVELFEKCEEKSPMEIQFCQFGHKLEKPMPIEDHERQCVSCGSPLVAGDTITQECLECHEFYCAICISERDKNEVNNR